MPKGEGNPLSIQNDEDVSLSPDFEASLLSDGRRRSGSAWSRHSLKVLAVVVIAMCAAIGIFLGLGVFGTRPDDGSETPPTPVPPILSCVPDQDCEVSIVETIPLGFDVPAPHHPSTYDVWMALIENANSSIDIATMYMTLTPFEKVSPAAGASRGEDVFNAIVAAAKRGVKVSITASIPKGMFPNHDLEYLNSTGLIELKYVDLAMLYPSGMLHSKFLIADKEQFYLGSANFDWRSLSQVKEVGVHMKCPCLTRDMLQVYNIYRQFANFTAASDIPDGWPSNAFDRTWNWANPAPFLLNGTASDIFLSAAPPVMLEQSRTSDLDAILWMIDNATTTIDVSVMDYAPAFVFTKPPSYWPDIDNALRAAAFNRGVQVNIMFGIYNETGPQLAGYAKSLNDFDNISVKLMHIPYQANVTHLPFTRVNHNKVMVTDRKVWLGTSNWSGDYFLTTTGISVVSGNTKLRDEMKALLDRDWNSPYSINVAQCSTLVCPSTNTSVTTV